MVRVSVENLSFFGAGGDRSAGSADAGGGVAGAGWVSWPVVA